MTKLGEFFTNFSRIDLDAQGGYARVSQIKTKAQEGYPEYCAFKLMRHEIDYQKGMERFEDELNLLVAITNDQNAPSPISRIYDCGFVPIHVSHALHVRKTPNSDSQFVSAGKDIQKFLRIKSAIEEKEPGKWLPYLLVELAPYDDNLLRQIHSQPKSDPSGLFRLPTGEVIAMSIQLLDVMQYLHKNHRRAYMDWKPEHIFWNGLARKVKLIDWNVTTSLDDGPGKVQNTRDDLRLFCGAVLYIGLTFIDPENSAKSIGPRPTTQINSPIPEIRRRYWTDNPDFYQRGDTLDEKIKQIIRRGLDPKQGFDSIQELRTTLLNYAQQELGLSNDELTLRSGPKSEYFRAIVEMRLAQQKLLQAQQYLIEAVKSNGETAEFTRSFDVIKRALKNFPAS